MLSKNQRKMYRKCGKRFGPFSVHSISNKKLCSSASKDVTQIDHVFLLKQYLGSDETKGFVWRKPPPPPHPPSAINKQLRDTEKIDLPSLTEKQILTEEIFDNYAINKLLNEIIQIVLVDAMKSSKNLTETYVILSVLLLQVEWKSHSVWGEKR